MNETTPNRPDGPKGKTTMFTLEIGGRAVAITDATPEAEARELLESLADEMIELESEGKQIWDGESPLHVRPATEDEIDSFDEAEMDEEPEEDDEPIVMFLIPIDGLDEDDEDED
ncbi:hypothetical protein ACTZWW_07185 [Salinarimonas sp. NSM]|uniref:hypothetical protein n=1 Tax=Salinarimonas sp. NSM TaxID=3458003 RepID=UPI0040374581